MADLGTLSFQVDVLPPGCAVMVDLVAARRKARFRAVSGPRSSRWSGWFDVEEGVTIYLSWAAFEWEEEPDGA